MQVYRTRITRAPSDEELGELLTVSPMDREDEQYEIISEPHTLELRRGEVPHFGYVRVSSDEQKRRGSSPIAQREKIVAFWDAEGFDGSRCVWGFDLGRRRMARIEKRPELLEILANIRKGSRVYISNRDRLGAGELNGHLSYLIRNAGGTLVSAEGFNGKGTGDVFYRAVQDARSEVELLEMGRRLQDVLRSRRRKLKTYTSRVYGWKKVSTLTGRTVTSIKEAGRVKGEDFKMVPDEREQRVVNFIFAEREKGTSWNEIAKQLNKQGVKPPKGQCWYHTGVRSTHDTNQYLREITAA